MNVTTDKPSATKTLLAAYAIAEYTTALEHLQALRSVGVSVPGSVVNRLERERLNIAVLWWQATHGDFTWTYDHMDTVVEECRAWVTEHIVELDDLIETSRRNQEKQ